MRIPSLLLLFPLLLAAQDAREIVRHSLELDQKNQAAARNYTYLQRQVERQFDGSGKVKSETIRTWDVTVQEGSPYRRLVARNDRPLPEAEQRAEEAKLQANIEQRRRETPQERERRLADWERRQQKQREPLRELPDAFNFRLAGEEPLNGGVAYVIDATPKPGYHPRTTAGAILPKMKGRFWISKDDGQWIKLDAETLAPISFGAFLVRVAKGAHIVLEQTRVNHEVWLPKRIALQGSARLFLFKGLHAELDIGYSEYKKFQVDSHVVPAGF